MICLDDNTIAAALDGALVPARAAELQQHLDRCPVCRRLLSRALAALDDSSHEGTDVRGDRARRSGQTQTTALTLSSVDRQSRRELAPGTTVDHYQVLRRIGAGGMGELYLARCTKLDRKVALKFVHEHLIGTQRAVERFLFEAKATARFSHPHIVAIYGVGEHADRPYVVLEYLEGETLRQRLAEGPLAPAEALAIGRAVAEAVGEAHTRGILHRDLKPANVMLCRDGRVRVLDFGLSSAVDAGEKVEGTTAAAHQSSDAGLADEQSRMIATATGGIFGTPRYMAPEQWLPGKVNPASDVWALGALLYELLTGRQLRRAGSPHGIRRQALEEETFDTTPLQRVLPAARARLLLSCLEHDPARRPPASALAAALAQPLAARQPTSRYVALALGVALGLGGLGLLTFAQQPARAPVSAAAKRPGVAQRARPGAASTVSPAPTAKPSHLESAKRASARVPSTRRTSGARRRARPLSRRRRGEATVIVQSRVGDDLVWAEVYLDGRYRGHTPLKLPNVGTGRHRIAVKRAGYRRLERAIRVKAGQVVRVPFELQRM